MKTCGSCQTEKPLADFSKKAASKDGLMSMCRECNRAKTAAWAAANRARRNGHQAAYRERTYIPSEGFAALSARPHVLYRAYDAEGELLYVGITVDPKTRLRHHREQKPWWVEVDRVTQEEHPDRASAQAVETAAILAENPSYNVRKRLPPVN